MPTGYTANLEKDYNLKRWLKESVVRAFGVCMQLRDEGNMSQSEIEAHLKKQKEEAPYHVGRFRELTTELDTATARSDKEWEALFTKEKARAQVDYDNRVVEHTRKKSAHLKALGEATTLHAKALAEGKGDLIVNALKFAVDQLTSSYDFDYGHEPYREDILSMTTFAELKFSVLKKTNRMLDYHREEMAKEAASMKKAGGSSYQMYKEFVEFVDKS